MVPRGLGMGYHVAPYYWFGCLKFYGVRGVRTMNLPHIWKVLVKSKLPTCPHGSAYHVTVLNLFKFKCVKGWREGPGWGLAPAPGYICVPTWPPHKVLHGFQHTFLLNSYNTTRRHLSSTHPILHEGPKFSLGHGHMAPMRPTPPRLGGLVC